MTDKIVIKVQVAPVTQKFKWEGSNQRHRFPLFRGGPFGVCMDHDKVRFTLIVVMIAVWFAIEVSTADVFASDTVAVIAHIIGSRTGTE